LGYESASGFDGGAINPKPSSPTATIWLGARLLMNLLVFLAHSVTTVVLHPAHLGSFANSQANIAGELGYLEMTVLTYFWYGS
jgi:hypothetical protein